MFPGIKPLQEQMWECIHCEGTYTGTLARIRSLGWTQPHVRVVLCDDCTKLYSQRRALAGLEREYGSNRE